MEKLDEVRSKSGGVVNCTEKKKKETLGTGTVK